MMDKLDISPKFKHSKICFSRCRNTNCSFSFWWLCTASTTGATEEYDGTSWTTSPASLEYSKRLLGGAGTQTAALAFGGLLQLLAATEEWTGAAPTTVTITAS
jgi:hypothetical protein